MAKARKPLPPPNPVTRKRHRAQVRTQIAIPLVLAGLILAGVIYAVASLHLGSAVVWAQISMILLGLPALALGGLALLFVILATIVITQALHLLPPYTSSAQQAVLKLEQQIRAGADVSVKPIITIKSYLALVESLFGRVNRGG